MQTILYFSNRKQNHGHDFLLKLRRQCRPWHHLALCGQMSRVFLGGAKNYHRGMWCSGVEFRRRGSNRETQSIKNKMNSMTKLQSALCNTESNVMKGFSIHRCGCGAETVYLHWPLPVSQLTSWAVTPGREQLHTSQPTRGWQPNVCGSHRTHSGCRVRGGQMHSPVTGSHKRVPQSHAKNAHDTTNKHDEEWSQAVSVKYRAQV